MCCSAGRRRPVWRSPYPNSKLRQVPSDSVIIIEGACRSEGFPDTRFAMFFLTTIRRKFQNFVVAQEAGSEGTLLSVKASFLSD
jgi:hypothetical protein